MMTNLSVIGLLVFVCFVITYAADTEITRTRLYVGFVYCEFDELARAQQIVDALNQEYDNSTSQIVLEIKSLKLTINENPVSLSLSVCNNLIASSIYAVIVGHTDCLANSVHKSKYLDNDDKTEYVLTLSAISFTCAYYQIPVLDLYSREADFSDRSVYGTFVRLSPPFFHQARLWIELIKEFEWRAVNLIHNSEHEGKMLASKFLYLADHQNIRIDAEIEYTANSYNFTDLVQRLAKSTTKVFLLQANLNDMDKILKLAEENELMTYGNVWIVCDELLLNESIAHLRNGVIVAKYEEENDLKAYSFALISKVFQNLLSSELFKLPKANCSENGLEWEIGKKAFEDMQDYKLNNVNIEFDDDGDRVSGFYRILNVVGHDTLREIGQMRTTQNEVNLELNKDEILWPGGQNKKPDGTKWSSKFKVVVIEEKPFIYKVFRPKDKKCSQIRNDTVAIDCPWSHKNVTQDFCCYGYCIELIQHLSQMLKFTYELYIVSDGLYGDLDKNHEWNGLMGEITNDRADLILAPFTINPERAAYVEFTKPFKYQGITILVKRKTGESSLVSFLQPFKDGLWIMVLLSVHVVALVLYLLDRFSPFGKFKLSKTDHTEEDALNLSRALWFTWGVLLNSGIGEGTPRSFSARVLGMVWAGFAMIMVASYTANLAAFLVLDRPEAGISGINDARLRNPSENYSYATVRGSAVERYFKRQVELSTMYRKMESKNYQTAEEAIEDLRNGKIQAFIWDSARLEYETKNSCDFITTGELFGRSSYAIALKRGNPWLPKFSMSILSLHENGIMEDLDQKWISEKNATCKTQEFPSTLGLANMAGVFMLVAGGVIVGIFLIFVEIVYKKRKDKNLREHELARKAFANWRKNIEKRKLRSARCSMDYSVDESMTGKNLLGKGIRKSSSAINSLQIPSTRQEKRRESNS